MAIGDERNQIELKNLSFVVESWPPLKVDDTGKKLEERFCYRNSEPSLRKLIRNCLQSMVLRNSTEQEILQIQESKSKFNGSQYGLFTLTHDHGQLTTYSQYVEIFGASIAYFEPGLSQLWISGYDNLSGFRRMNCMNFNGYHQGYFTVESIPGIGKQNCRDSPLAKNIVECQGAIHLGN